ncbi:hypothetical protein FACS1894159_02180 [Bacteroidia bacterium]|nr:hypothetical protein FACS1894159_02180 [Bacteroidia bacterium]
MKLLAGILAVVAMAGCIHEDRKGCYQWQHEVVLRYPKGIGGLQQHISLVDMFVFDNTGSFVGTYNIARERLDESLSVKLDLPPGLYTLVGWGNAYNNNFVDMHTLTDARMLNVTALGNRIAVCDRLYYAMTTLSICEGTHNGDQVQYLDFDCVHLRLAIQIEGPFHPDQLPLKVEIWPTGSKFDFTNRPDTEATCLGSSITGHPAGETLEQARVVVPKFDLARHVYLVLNEATGRQLTTPPFDLTQHIIDAGINIDNLHGAEIVIRFHYDGANLTIVLGDWNDGQTETGIK